MFAVDIEVDISLIVCGMCACIFMRKNWLKPLSLFLLIHCEISFSVNKILFYLLSYLQHSVTCRGQTKSGVLI